MKRRHPNKEHVTTTADAGSAATSMLTMCFLSSSHPSLKFPTMGPPGLTEPHRSWEDAQWVCRRQHLETQMDP